MSVNLSQGQSVNLEASDGAQPATIRMGLGWRALKHSHGLFARMLGRGRDVDLDASAVLLSGHDATDVVYFRRLSGGDGSVTHTGDNVTGGAGQEDDESILVDLTRVPERIDQIVFTVSSFTGQTFARVEQAFCRLVDETTGRELARYTLAGGGDHTALIMAKVHRANTTWHLTALGTPTTGRTFQDLLPSLRHV